MNFDEKNLYSLFFNFLFFLWHETKKNLYLFKQKKFTKNEILKKKIYS
jgi:hypothetical protein